MTISNYLIIIVCTLIKSGLFINRASALRCKECTYIYAQMKLGIVVKTIVLFICNQTIFTHHAQYTLLTLKLFAHFICIDWFIQHFNSEWLIEIWTYLVFYSFSVQKIKFSPPRKIENDFNKNFFSDRISTHSASCRAC